MDTSGYITKGSGPINPRQELTMLTPATQKEVSNLLKKSAPKTCGLDPIPTQLLKKCSSVTISVLTNIINKTLKEGMPTAMRVASVTPILKKPHLDAKVLKNYRPISNLSFVSKLTEKIVAERLISHLQNKNLQEPLQSAYRKHCSTETALLKVQDDILKNLDKRKGVVLLLLDLSAAFDTIDHGTLINTLENEVGVTGECLAWIQSYLEERQQRVIINNSRSDSRTLKCGVPQGSVLGPLLFSIYTIPLAAIMRKHGILYHLYADDTQLYLEFSLSDTTSRDNDIHRLELCNKDIRTWMRLNMLKLNDDKTELLIIYPKSSDLDSLPDSVDVGNITIKAATEARNLGVIFDSTMSSGKHVASICRSAYFHLHAIGRIRKFLDQQSTKQLVHALVLSRLDTCNSLLGGLPSNLLQRLQQVQNMCARIIMLSNKRDHVTPLMKELHWLPIKCRINYKLLMLTFKCLHQLAPQYLADLVTIYEPGRYLRSSNTLSLTERKARTKTYGERTFSYMAPRLWNALPSSLRQCQSITNFKTKLKTHLFKNHYDS